MKFKYDYNMIPSSSVNITAGLESLNHSTPSYFELSELAYDIRSSMIDFNFTAFGTESDEGNSNDPWYKKMWKFIKDLFFKIIGFIKSGFKWIKKKIFGEKEEVKKQSEVARELIKELNKLIDENKELKKKYEVNTAEYIEEITEMCAKLIKGNKKIAEGKSDEELAKIMTEVMGVIKNELSEFTITAWILNEDVSSRVNPRTNALAKEIPHVDNMKKPVTNILITATLIEGMLKLFYGEDQELRNLYESVKGADENYDDLNKVLEYVKAIENKTSKYATDKNAEDLLVELKVVVKMGPDGKFNEDELKELDKVTAATEDGIDGIVGFLDNQNYNIEHVESSINVLDQFNNISSLDSDYENKMKVHKERISVMRECLKHLSNASMDMMKIFNKSFRGKLGKTKKMMDDYMDYR
nr:MAG TPA: hypothetical protein [Caudoviricetes sp.]